MYHQNNHNREPEQLRTLEHLRVQERELRAAATREKPRRFKDYCAAVLDGYEQGRIDRSAAADAICGLLSDDELRANRDIYPLISEACDFELPEEPGEPRVQGWEELVERIRNLGVF